MLIKYRKCECGAELWGLRLRNIKKCEECNTTIPKKKSKTKEYYRIQLFCIVSETNLNDVNRWDCHYRSYCLESTFKDGLHKGLACKGCNFYKGNPI